jgi:hypothetical protein
MTTETTEKTERKVSTLNSIYKQLLELFKYVRENRELSNIINESEFPVESAFHIRDHDLREYKPTVDTDGITPTSMCRASGRFAQFLNRHVVKGGFDDKKIALVEMIENGWFTRLNGDEWLDTLKNEVQYNRQLHEIEAHVHQNWIALKEKKHPILKMTETEMLEKISNFPRRNGLILWV